MAKKIFKVVKGAALGFLTGGPSGALAGGAVGLAGALGKKKHQSQVDNGPAVMPIADDEAVMNARRKSIAGQMRRGGRSSTILSSGDGSTLGGS